MTNLSNKSVHLITMVFILLAFVSLSSCRQSEQTSLPTFSPIETPEADYFGTDDVGEYMIGSERSIQDESGFMLKIEERVYEDLAKSRFIVTQRNLGLRAQSVGMKAVNFFAYPGGSEIDTSTLNANSNLNASAFLSSAVIGYQSSTSEGVFMSELYDYHFSDALELLDSKENLAKKACGVIKVDFADETFDPIVLDTCYHPAKPI